MARWLLTNNKCKEVHKTTMDREMLWIAHFLHEGTTEAVSTNSENIYKDLNHFFHFSRTNERDVYGEHKATVERYEEWLSGHHRCYVYKKLVARRP